MEKLLPGNKKLLCFNHEKIPITYTVSLFEMITANPTIYNVIFFLKISPFIW